MTRKLKVSSSDVFVLVAVRRYLRWPASRSTWLNTEPDLSLRGVAPDGTPPMSDRSCPLDESNKTPLLGGSTKKKIWLDNSDLH